MVDGNTTIHSANDVNESRIKPYSKSDELHNSLNSTYQKLTK